MAPSKLKKAIGRVKDQTKISIAKVSGSTSLSDLDVAIVKATKHEEHPADDRYFREIIYITRSCIPARVFLFHTAWDSILNLSDFRDATRNESWDFSAFVRTYALYLDERLEYKIQDRRGEKPYKMMSGNDEEKEEESNDKDNVGAAKCHRVVTVALYQIVKESFQLYYDITEILSIYIDRFTELDLAESLNAYDIFCRQGKQLDELDNFYSWCKTAGIGQTSAYPEIEKITQKKLDLIDELVRVAGTGGESARGPVEKEPEKGKEGDDSKAIVRREFDYFNLGKDAMSSEEQAEKFALALFEDGVPARPPPSSGWESFEDEVDWGPTSIQWGSNFNHQKANLGGGLLMLDGMDQRGQSMKVMASQGATATGSASSIVFGSACRPEVLVLSAPLSSDGRTGASGEGDPFAASLVVAPPTYVQMSDMEKKQRFLEMK
ncbi:hypothetical protein F3Y22_tig00110597pilonHSYRG00343 [Hibiscus syriacus]|uniref:ENTH domain-containing protein n=1 Tax=Hibiscus syriacus TaxID=106335 RepID=A0A6A3A5L3_HIBSY|nr:hypothetical protein F3Y22_tig00110597pilonHSYRG00343 [Hibiscus syriacus]